MKKTINILITCVGGEYGPELINSFRNNRFIKKMRIIGVDTKESLVSKAFLDKFYLVPSTKKKNYIKIIDRIIKINKINIVLPTSDEESLILSKFYQNSRVKIICSDYKQLKILSNKIKTYKVLELNNIPLPKWFEINSEYDFIKGIKFFKENNKPFCVKPAISRGSRNVLVINNNLKSILNIGNSRERHLNFKTFLRIYKKVYKNKYPLIMMEKLKAQAFDIDILSKNGKLINAICRKRVDSILHYKGHIIFNNKYLYNLSKKLSKIFKLNYLHDCDLMLDNKGNFRILEINPRPSGSVALSIAAGIPLIENLLCIYFNKNKYFKIKKIKKNALPYTKILAI
jgi:carbamoylphosphate synthase large subunit